MVRLAGTMLRPVPHAPTISIERLSEERVLEMVAWDISRLSTQLCGRPIELSIEEVQRIVAATDLVVAFNDDGVYSHVVGMMCLVWMPLPQGMRLLVESFVVDEDHRKKGIAGSLMDHVARRAREEGVAHVSLTCNPRREEAQAFYRSVGFQPADTMVLRKQISSS